MLATIGEYWKQQKKHFVHAVCLHELLVKPHDIVALSVSDSAVCRLSLLLRKRLLTPSTQWSRILAICAIITGYIVPYFFKLPQFADAPAGWEALNGIPPAGLVQVNIFHYIHMYNYKQ
jgi:hypothetical protein